MLCQQVQGESPYNILSDCREFGLLLRLRRLRTVAGREQKGFRVSFFTYPHLSFAGTTDRLAAPDISLQSCATCGALLFELAGAMILLCLVVFRLSCLPLIVSPEQRGVNLSVVSLQRGSL